MDAPAVSTPAVSTPAVSTPAVSTPAVATAGARASAASASGSSGVRATGARSRIEPLAAARYGVHFTAGEALRGKLERARALASHRLPSGELASLIELALDALLEKPEKRRFALRAEPKPVGAVDEASRESRPPSSSRSPGDSATQSSPKDGAGQLSRTPNVPGPLERACGTGERHASRRVPAATAREVYGRDGGRCTFVSADGRRCSGRAFLELDHIVPWAEGGGAEPNNVRLLCRAHNAARARERFGDQRGGRNGPRRGQHSC
jgi:hypothetical protein